MASQGTRWAFMACNYIAEQYIQHRPLSIQISLPYHGLAQKKGALQFSGLWFFKCTCAVPYLDYRHANFARNFHNIPNKCLRTAKALARLCLCAGSLLVTCDSILFSCAGANGSTSCSAPSLRTITSINCISLGPVVQSVVSLTSSLRVISLTILADSIYNIFCWKNVSSFCTAKATHIFSAKNFSIFAYPSIKILTNR